VLVIRVLALDLSEERLLSVGVTFVQADFLTAELPPFDAGDRKSHTRGAGSMAVRVSPSRGKLLEPWLSSRGS
jgi:hypothetical protein